MTHARARRCLDRPRRPTPARSTIAFYDLVETRFVRLVRDNPVLGTALGLHEDDDLFGDGSREAVLASSTRSGRTSRRSRRSTRPACRRRRRSSATSSSTTSAARSSTPTCSGIWERRSFALDTVGDGLFLLFARDHAPLAERLDAIAGRLEAIATYLEEAKTRATVPQVRRWQRIELETAAELPSFFDELVAAGVGVLPDAEQRRLERAAEAARSPSTCTRRGWRARSRTATDDWPIGRERHDAMVALRAFDGLDSDAILALGWERLREEHEARAAAAREIDPDADELTVIDRVKSDQPPTFDDALEAYRGAMLRARASTSSTMTW